MVKFIGSRIDNEDTRIKQNVDESLDQDDYLIWDKEIEFPTSQLRLTFYLNIASSLMNGTGKMRTPR